MKTPSFDVWMETLTDEEIKELNKEVEEGVIDAYNKAYDNFTADVVDMLHNEYKDMLVEWR